MENILIIEDELSIRENLILMAKEINSEIIIYDSGSAKEALLISKNHKIDAFFIDIELTDYTGLRLAKKLREMNRYQFTPIVFITGMPTRELEAFREIHCYDYILKPFRQEEVKHTFKKILVDYMNIFRDQSEKKFCMEFKNMTQLIDYDDIVYVEYDKYRVTIHTIDESIKYQIIPLRKFMSRMPDNFVQIHQNYGINTKHVISVGIRSMTIAINHIEEPLPLGSSYIDNAKEIIHELY